MMADNHGLIPIYTTKSEPVGQMKAHEFDPTGLAPNEPGAKLDAGKIMAGVLADFPRALSAVAEVGTFGAKKYSRGGWQSVSNGVERYTDAMWRHLLAERINPIDSDSGLAHAAQVAWNALARLELELRANGASQKNARAEETAGRDDLAWEAARDAVLAEYPYAAIVGASGTSGNWNVLADETDRHSQILGIGKTAFVAWLDAAGKVLKNCGA